ncbi:hypothetical protein KR200_000912 [Drosophila serrata]|nr:hypothetical protein KR200_000912 [Drosophila serrata]
MVPRPRTGETLHSRRSRLIQSYRCRVRRGIHPLLKCKRFQKLSAQRRLRAVLINKYCSNCIAHHHSEGTCRSTNGCKNGGGSHHTLLHIHEEPRRSLPAAAAQNSSKHTRQLAPRRRTEPRPSAITVSRSPSPAIESTRPAASTPSSAVAAFLHQKVVHVFPTACVVLDTGTTIFERWAMIDPCVAVSSIDRSLAPAYRQSTVETGDDEVCSATIQNVRFDVVLRVEPHVRIRTSIRELRETVRTHFRDITLADERFHVPATISMVLGADMCLRVMQLGFLKIQDGLPVAQSTVFGWVVSGAFHQPSLM